MKELKRDNCKLHKLEENQRVMKAKNQKQLFRIFVSTCMKCGDNEQKSKPKVKKKIQNSQRTIMDLYKN